MRSPARLRRDVVPMIASCALTLGSCAGARRGDAPLARAEAAVAEVGLLHEGPGMLLDVTITVRGRAARELRACGADFATVVAEASAARSRRGTEPGPPSAATAFRDALAARGLGSLHDSLVAARQVTRIAPALVAAGFAVERNATSLTYLGFALADERSLLSAGARVVSDVDPEGPAAMAGLRRGDSIVVVEAPTRGDPPWIGPAVDRRHGAGLAEIASGATSVRIRVQRAEGARDLLVRPRLIPGGYREVARPPASGTMAFFRPAVAGASCPR